MREITLFDAAWLALLGVAAIPLFAIMAGTVGQLPAFVRTAVVALLVALFWRGLDGVTWGSPGFPSVGWLEVSAFGVLAWWRVRQGVGR